MMTQETEKVGKQMQMVSPQPKLVYTDQLPGR